MMVELVTLFAILIFVGAGLALRAAAGAPNDGLFNSIAGAFWLGIAACGAIAPAALLLNLPARETTAAVLGFLSVAGFAFFIKNKHWRPFAKGDLCILMIAVGGAAVVAYISNARPMAYGDEVVLWGYKSAMFTETGRFDPSAWSLSPIRGPNYPPAVPVAASMASILTGRFEPAACRMFSIAGFVAFVVSIGSLVSLRNGRFFSCIITAATAFLPIALTESARFMADTMFTGALAAAAAQLLTRENATIAWLQLAAVASIKIEGAPIAIAVAVFLYFTELARSFFSPNTSGARAAGITILKFALFFCILAGPWIFLLISKGFHPLSGEPAGSARAAEITGALGSPGELLHRFAAVGASLSKSIVASAFFSYWLLGVILLFAGGANARPHFRDARFFALAAAIIVAQATALAIAPSFQWQLEAVSLRATFHLIPAVLLLSQTCRELDPSRPLH